MPRRPESILAFLKSLDIHFPLPAGVSVLNPYRQPAAWRACELFYRSFYADSQPRYLILGINPGRLGGGITGIPFTDPVHLHTHCGIQNTFAKKAELSSTFIYRVVDAWGGAAEFYRRFYLSAVSPLGFTRGGKNLNYYDVPPLKAQLVPLVHKWLQQQLRFGLNRQVVFCIGETDNLRFLEQVNAAGGYFGRVVALPHPRFIMQYRRQQAPEFVALYRQRLSLAGAQ